MIPSTRSQRPLPASSSHFRFALSAFGFVAVTSAGLSQPRPLPAMPTQLDLPTAISVALESNFAIRQARARIRAEEGVVTEVRANALPSVAASANYQRSEIATVQSPPGGPVTLVPEGTSWRMTLTGSQLLFAGGGVRASIRRAELNREAAVLDLRAVLNGALLEVRTRFYDVLLAREQVKVQEQNLELLQGQLRYATVRADVGTTSDFERLRAEVAVANAKTPLIRARNDHRLALEELRRVIGLTNIGLETEHKVPELVGTLAFEPTQFDLQEALDSARGARPELQRLTNLIAVGEEGVAVARARYMPNLVASGGGEMRSGANENLSDALKGLRGGVRSQLQISAGTRGAVAQAASQVEQLRLAESETSLAIEIEIRRAFSALEQAVELSGAMQKTVAQAEEAGRLATARFEAGTATQLDVLQSQVDLTSARLSNARANHGYNVARARLRAAMGFSDVAYEVNHASETAIPRGAVKP